MESVLVIAYDEWLDGQVERPPVVRASHARSLVTSIASWERSTSSCSNGRPESTWRLRRRLSSRPCPVGWSSGLERTGSLIGNRPG